MLHNYLTIVLMHRSRSVVILRPSTYAEALSEARIVFSLATDADFLLRTTVSFTEAGDATEEAWPSCRRMGRPSESPLASHS